MAMQDLSVKCPDPSVHRQTHLQDSASAAALLAASPKRSRTDASDILDKDKKLSSKSAATSLKYARAEDLPSYPSAGGLTSTNSNNAALLAHGNQKPFEHWKPEPSSSAGKAALLAKDYKPAPLWKPGMSEAGSKAALLAHKDGGRVDLWSPQATPQGSTAATLAYKNSVSSPRSPQNASTPSQSKALLAATRSVNRNRSGSLPSATPSSYPDSKNSTYNALNAATKANRKSTNYQADDYEFSSPALEESRIKHLSSKITREMFTEHPPIAWEVEDKRHQDALKASAVSMAKDMYAITERNEQKNASTSGATAASAAANRRSVGAQPDIKQQAMQYIHLQEAARRLADERLAKLDPDGSARYREHYGYPLRSPTRKLSIKNKYRRRAKSESEAQLSDSDDDLTSRRIRRQMNQFNKEIETIDEKKRTTDRAALLAAAERKVQAQMHSMDEKVYAETGKVSPAMMEQWEAKAREKAAKDSAARTQNYGKTDIGGGKFMEHSEIEAIAAARLKPTLDEINDNAEKRRARDEEIRLDQEQKRRQELKEKERERESKYIQKRTRDEEKAAAKQAKADQKAAQKQEREEQKTAAKIEKEADKARQAEEKKAAHAADQQTKEAKEDAAKATVVSAAVHDSNDTEHENSPKLGTTTEITSGEAEANDEVIAPASEKKHMGTDSEIGKAPAALAIGTDKETKKDRVTSGESSPQSPSKSGFGKIMDRFRRKSKHDTGSEPGTLSMLKRRSVTQRHKEDGGEPKSSEDTKASKDDAEDLKSTADPTSPGVAPLSAVEAKAVADKHADAAEASPSSFVRGAAAAEKDNVSSLSELSSDGEELDLSLRDPAKDEEKKDAAEEKPDWTTESKGFLGTLGLGIGGGKKEGSTTGSVEAGKSPRETKFQEEL